MFGLNSIYHPITALPGVHNNSYMELPPCPALTPYIRCFWGSAGPVRHCEIPGRPVIPDTCMDLIFYTNYSQNQYDGQFTALDEGTYQSEAVDSPDITSIFAIRFYGWSAVLFSDRSMKGSRNQAFCTDAFFGGLKKELEPVLCNAVSLREKISAAEGLLMNRLHTCRTDHNLMNSLYHILQQNGNVKISDLCSYTGVSKKTLERIFHENTGVSPKTMQSLIRYQLLWQDIYFHRRFNALDAVAKYGYFDQAHLLRDFKRRHTTTPAEALRFALENI